MKRLLAILLTCGTALAETRAQWTERMADAIFRAEGGFRTKYPYGVKSVRVRDRADARRICVRSIGNNLARWEAAGQPKPFVEFMADRWCPVESDAKGHANWIRNVTFLMRKSNH